MSQKIIRIPGRWMIHSYYSLCPYAPNESGQLLAAGCDLSSQTGKVYILDQTGQITASFGEQRVLPSFFHTGFWQSWGPDGKTVYFSASDGNPLNPRFGIYELETGRIRYGKGDLEGIAPLGEPSCFGLHGMLYAAGYGDGRMHPENSPVPFSERQKHGLFRTVCGQPDSELALSTQDLLPLFPNAARFREDDRRFAASGGLTMMVYCVRYSRDGKRLLFHLGNHCVEKKRGEPKLMAIYTATRDLQQIRLALDLSYGKNGVHWSWHPDGEHLIGYGPRPDAPDSLCLAMVHCDGSGYRMVSPHCSGGHPSVSPADDRVCVTDETSGNRGFVVFLDLRTGREIGRVELPKYRMDPRQIPRGRNPYFVCHHPVFNWDGSKVLCNQLPGRDACLVELDVAELLQRWGWK